MLTLGLSLVEEIPHIIHTLTEGSPLEQKTALEKYFQPNASFEHPFCRVPNFSRFSMPLIGVINSRWVIWMIYRWYKILSPRIIVDVHSLGMSGFPWWNTYERKQGLRANCTLC